jgi:hypothetical protein
VGKNLEIVGNPLHFQHPVTTFYRWGQNNWFDPLKSQAQNLATLRQMLIKAFNSDFEHPSTSNFHKFRAVYKNIYDQAQNTEHLYYDPEESEGHSNYTAAKTARACAFVLLAGFNDEGVSLGTTDIAALKNRATSIIKRLEKDENRNDDLYWTGWFSSWYSKHYWIEKNLIMLLQAYDYLKAVYPDDSDVNDCGFLLQCYTRHIYYSGTQMFSGFMRNDNHALQLSGAVGLASIVLADYSSTSYNDSWHPDRWFNTATWKTLKTLYKHETIRETDHGFAEGPHYARHSLENLFPFFLSYTNVRPEITGNEKYGPEGLWQMKVLAILKSSRSLSIEHFVPLFTEQMDHSLWHDPDLSNIVEWYSEMLLPDRTYFQQEDSYSGLIWDGILAFRAQVQGVAHPL